MERLERRLGFLSALPIMALLTLSFVMPLLVVAGFAIMPQKVFSLAHLPDFSSFRVIIEQGYYRSLLRSLGLAFLTTTILFVICWPLAYGMAKVFGRFTLVITLAVVMLLFVSENVRLFGWNLTLMKGGLLEGHMRAWLGTGFESPLYGWPVIVFGMVYVYLPFMLFPLAQGISLVPDDARLAAADLGAGRWRILFQIEMPLAAPGIMVGCLLTFVLSAGAIAEAKLLGGRSVVVLTDDVESAFTFGQNWPLGSALSLMLIVIVALLVLVPISRIDLDTLMGRKR
ncbi:Spermidine/putrescine transport system permease protein PotB [Paracoccus haematequi]|uniref:Spermidine/putrescine transport system permease protein PotB n=1 Tax=Paracoccus haematequi TaxID=2491866 RepID=A0A3S4CYE1_9RHOB|nr:ABC transporter permease [Paracoccus haematequi]VDS08429.1 Spermidine/putrescine transport system permease protein PotB [Paracoccus haematequi]